MLLAVCRDPFGLSPQSVRHFPAGASLADVVAGFDLPPAFRAEGVVCINGAEVPRGAWHLVRPRPGSVTEVTLHLPLQGGGRGVKTALSVVAAVALIAATAGAASGAFATGSGLFLKGSLSAQLLGGAIRLAGGLLLTALSSPPSSRRRREDTSQRTLGSASASGNVLEPGAPLPLVAGRRKVFPPHLMEPFVHFDGDDEVAEAVVGLSGPHLMEELRIGDAAVAGLGDVDIQTNAGWPGAPAPTLIRRYARTQPFGRELRGHRTDDSDGLTLDSGTGSLTDALPQAINASGRQAPDEMWIEMEAGQGLGNGEFPTRQMRVPVRLRLRLAGGAAPWRNLPELHYRSSGLTPRRFSVHIAWLDDASASPAVSGRGWVEAQTDAPAQEIQPQSGGWQADGYFRDGAGDAWLTQGNAGTTGVRHVLLGTHVAQVLLDRAEWPPGRYEVEVTRGYQFRDSDWSAAAYTLSGTVRDLFGFEGATPRIHQTQTNLLDRLALQRVISIWNRPPVAPNADIAWIAIRARNRPVDQISTLAGGYVQDWDAEGRAQVWSVTSNPAPHLRAILAGRMNARAVPAESVDDAELIEWRAHCAAEGHEVNAVLEGESVIEAARIVSGAGFGQPRQADLWGVAQDRDRSSEAPVQMFTRRNMRAFGWARAFPFLPDGFRATFADRDDDFSAREIVVYRRPGQETGGVLESIAYDALVTEAEVRKRALYDLMTPEKRGTFYTFEAPPEAIRVRRGSLIAVQVEDIVRRHGAARVQALMLDGAGDVTGVTLDQPVEVAGGAALSSVAAMGGIGDMSLLGLVPGVALRRDDGSVSVHALAQPAGPAGALALAEPAAAAGLGTGALAAVGPLKRSVERLVVSEMQPREGQSWEITAVDESDIWQALEART